MSQEVPPASAAKHSAVEVVKENSQALRGTLAHELATDSDHFGEADKQLLKFHGSYQQEDRDARKNRRKDGIGKHYMFMVRCKIPGGRLNADQYLALDDLAGRYANGTIRITSRQGIQLHGVLKGNLRDTIAGINECLLSTLGACGDVNRNVMVDPSPGYDQGLVEQLQATGNLLAVHFAPRSAAYHEIWLNSKPIADPKQIPEEPIYGKTYLPRKFKIGLALPENNLIDIYAQDLGFLAVVENGAIAGYNVLVGGGMGMSHGNRNTFPQLAQPVGYVPAEQVLAAAEAVVKLFRDHGNRDNRKRARIKYLIHDWGVPRFREVMQGYLDHPLAPAKLVEVTGYDLCLGWRRQGNGKYWYGIHVTSGRIKDEGACQLRRALRTVIDRLRPQIRLSPHQDILLCDLGPDSGGAIERILRDFGVSLPGQLSPIELYSMACPAVPTCGLALSEAERILPGVVAQLQTELRRLGLEQERISVRITGCPNGCARPYQSDIGIVGRSGDKYTLFVGGTVLGNRLNFQLQDLVPADEIVTTLLPLLERFRQERSPDESFGDFCQRLGSDRLGATE
jgi:sulfite reductase (ferredoxin)